MNKKLIPILILSMIFFQCSKKAMLRKYYVLEIASPQLESSLDSLEVMPYRFEVRDISIAKAYNQTRIALRSASHELNYYFYHNWAVRPPVAIGDLVYQIMKSSGACPMVNRGYMLDPEYIVAGYIDQLERNERNPRPVAHISGEFELLRAKDETPIFKYRFDRETRLIDGKDMNTFANAISQILFEESQGFIRGINKKLMGQTSEQQGNNP